MCFESMSENYIHCFHRSLKYCDLRVIGSSYLQRTTLEQELGLAAYLVRAESRPLHNPGPGSDLLESDAEKLSSTDNEEEEEQDNAEMRGTCTDFETYEMFTWFVIN